MVDAEVEVTRDVIGDISPKIISGVVSTAACGICNRNDLVATCCAR